MRSHFRLVAQISEMATHTHAPPVSALNPCPQRYNFFLMVGVSLSVRAFRIALQSGIDPGMSARRFDVQTTEPLLFSNCTHFVTTGEFVKRI